MSLVVLAVVSVERCSGELVVGRHCLPSVALLIESQHPAGRMVGPSQYLPLAL
jgi:hypothetical protein